jgi:hypothetical protein
MPIDRCTYSNFNKNSENEHDASENENEANYV